MYIGKNGNIYCYTPVALCWNDDKYYLICYNPKYEDFTHYRVDRMSIVEICEEKADKPDKKCFNLAQHTKRYFGMFTGELVFATLWFDNSLVNPVLDRFGSDAVLYKRDDGFEVRAEVSDSPVFLSWVFQFGDKAEILAPESLRQSMAKLISDNAAKYSL